MVAPHWGSGWVACCLPAGGEGGSVVLPAGGEGYLFVKLIPVFVCCCVRFSVANFSLSHGCGFQFHILLVFLFVFVACFSLSVFLLLFRHFVNFPTLKSVSPVFCSDFLKKIHSFIFSLFENLEKFYYFTAQLPGFSPRKFNLTSQVTPKQPKHSFSFIF